MISKFHSIYFNKLPRLKMRAVTLPVRPVPMMPTFLPIMSKPKSPLSSKLERLK